MSRVHIVTDSSCDLTDAETDALGIDVVPLTIRFGTDEYIDREQLSVEDFYAKMASTGLLPETAAPSPGRFEQEFRAAARGRRRRPSCASTSPASCRPRCSPPAPRPRRSRARSTSASSTASRSPGASARWCSTPPTPRPAAPTPTPWSQLVESMIGRTEIYGALDTLDNLKKGGRIGGAQALLGSMLSVKPIIDIVDGTVEEAGKQRTRRKALEWLRDKLFEEPVVEELSVLHGEAPDIDDFLDLISPRYPRESIRLGKIGAVIGTHGGPGVIGMCYLKA